MIESNYIKSLLIILFIAMLLPPCQDSPMAGVMGGSRGNIMQGGGGAAAFTALTDTFSSYTGHGAKVIRVNLAEDALEPVALAGGGDMLKATYDSDTDNRIDTTAGGTDINTSGSTGVPSISAGTWSVAATLTHELGGLETDVNAYGGILAITGGSTYELNLFSELQSAISDKTLCNEEDVCTLDANWVNTTNPWSVDEGGTGAATFTDGGILLGSGTGAITALGVASNGQIPIGDGTTDPQLATITGTANQVTVTNGPGSITLSLPSPIVRDLTGNASTATALAADPTDCGANQYANVIGANGNLGCGSIVDADVPDTITVSNYLLLAGGVLTGEVTVDNLGLEFTEGDDHSDCSAFSATGGGIWYDDSEGKFKKCQDNVLTDLDTGGGASVEDDAYGSGWNGDTTNAPSQNAVYDYLHLIDTDDDGVLTDEAAITGAEGWLDADALACDSTSDGLVDLDCIEGFQPSATPQVNYNDSDATAGDDNVRTYANCTDTGDGSEDCDYTIAQQIAGSLTDVMIFDADGSITSIKDFILSQADPDLIFDDTDGADGIISVDANDADDAVMVLGVDDSVGDDQPYIELDGVNERVEIKKAFLLEDSLFFTDQDASPAAVGEMLYDNSVTGLDDGALAWYDDDEIRYIIDLDASEGELESGDDGHVVTFHWNGGSGYYDLTSPAGGGDMLTSTYDADTDGDIDQTAGGLEADVSAYTGLIGLNTGAVTEVDTAAELETFAGLGAAFNEYADDATVADVLVTLGLTATASEINTPLDGASVTLTEFQELETIGDTTISANQWALLGGVAETLAAAELDILDGATLATTDLNIIDGIGDSGTLTAEELLHVDGVTSAIQTQFANILNGTTAFTGFNLTGDITQTAGAYDYDLVDNNASALSFDASGKAGILEIVTTDGSEQIKMSGDLSVAGQITGRGFWGADITGNISLNTTDLHSKMYQVTAACTITLDAALDAGYGAQVLFWIRDASETVIIEIDAADKINLHGTPLDAGDTIDSPGNAGDFIVLVATTDADGGGTDGWITFGYGEAVWTDGGAT